MGLERGDVQNRRLTNSFSLTRVGVTGVRKPVVVHRGSKQIPCNCWIDIFVDLPMDQRGSHLSRNLEAIEAVIDRATEGPIQGLEFLCADLCRELLLRHEYATISETYIEADYFLPKAAPSGRKNLEAFKLFSKATARRNGGVTKLIGVKVVGMTVCPCAMESVREIYGCLNPNADLPTISHNQRNNVSVLIEVPEELDLEANRLIELVESSFSSPTHEMLKRNDEARVVMTAHTNPKFVEDVVRGCLYKLALELHYLPDGMRVIVKSDSEESIHKHNAYAEIDTTLGEIRKTMHDWVKTP